MRFEADGPDIPLELIEARDRGEVVFLCGAGVSMPAGMPSFHELARDVVRELGVPTGDPTRALLERALFESDPIFAPPMDQVFGVLQRDYGAKTVEMAVARRLRRKRGAALETHRTILRLSADPFGRRRLVTTNFDRLFEASDSRLSTFAPPLLPDLAYGAPLHGVTYLHGRIPSKITSQERLGLILSAPDFGRAYLAEGWATHFIRQLLDRYSLVLLGYSADDPPVRYLLEGLHASGRREGRLFAFAAGSEEDGAARWNSRGVHSIAYTAHGGEHGALWQSLQGWATRADDVVGWRAGIVTLAHNKPHKLTAHQRGQVVALVSTLAGAKAFAEASPPPPAEWLCVFDNQVRFSRPGRPFLVEETALFSPFEAYGLDNDSPNEDRPYNQAAPGVNVLQPLGEELRTASYAGLTPGPLFVRALLAPRLRQLAWWLSKVSLEPAALWWAAGQMALQPWAVEAIQRELLTSEAAQAPMVKWWRLLLEAWKQLRPIQDHSWYEITDRISNEGWSGGVRRAFREAVLPRLKAQRPPYREPRPPAVVERRQDVLELDVTFVDGLTGEFQVPDAELAFVVENFREGLLHARSLLNDVGPLVWRTPSLHPQNGDGETVRFQADIFFLFFAQLFDRLANLDSDVARAELQQWPADEPYFFDKLRLWTWQRSDLVPASAVAEGLQGLTPDATWRFDQGREWLWTVRARWPEFNPTQREEIEAILLTGPPIWEEEVPEEFVQRRASASATRLGWLELNGCVLSESARAQLSELREVDPRWSPAWDRHADDSHEGRSGVVKVDTNSSSLRDLPLGAIADRAVELSQERGAAFVRAKPFDGLVRQRPGRALSVLGFEARKGRYPTRLWAAIADAHDVVLPPRIQRLFAARLCWLPDVTFIELRFSISGWIERNFVALHKDSPDLAWHLWDAVFNALVRGGEEATRSGIGETRQAGIVLKQSRKTLGHAINAPVGNMLQPLMSILDDLKLNKSQGLPLAVRTRFLAALGAPGEGADHAALIIFRSLAYLEHVDPRFTQEDLLPAFDPENALSEAAWGGFLSGQSLVSVALFRRLKASFFTAFERADKWLWDGSNYAQLAEFLIAMSLQPKGAYLTLEDARRALQTGGPIAGEGVLQALLRRSGGDNAWKDIRTFIVGAWPKELRFRTPEIVRRLAQVAIEAGDDFPAALRTIRPFLAPVTDLRFLVSQLGRATARPGLATRFPREALQLMDALIETEPQTLPYEIDLRLNEIASASPELRQTFSWRRLKVITGGGT